MPTPKTKKTTSKASSNRGRRKRKDASEHPVTQYAKDVLAGKVVAGRLVRLACERHLRDLEFGHNRGLTFSEDAADHVLEFFPRFLCFAEGQFAGEPFILQPFQKFIVGSLFGWMGPDGFRRFRKAYIEIAKGSGKSPLAAGIGIYGLMADGEEGAEIFAAAVTRDQAGIIMRDAKLMAQASPKLRDRLTIGINNIAYGNSFMRAVSSEARSLDGKRVHIALIDELHEHPSAIVVEKVQANTKGRRQPLIFEITNSGYDRNSVCWQHHEYSADVLKGVRTDDGWFSYIAQLDVCAACQAENKTSPTDGCKDCDDWRDEQVWLKANPNLDISVTTKYLREQVHEAEGMPSKENMVKRLNFCIWTQQNNRWINMEAWDACAGVVIPEQLKGRECFGGLDLSSTTDLSAFVLVFRPQEEDEPWQWLCRFWMAEDNILEREKKDKWPYSHWVQKGFIEPTEGNVIDHGVIRERIREDADMYRIREIAFDRHDSTYLITQLMGDGFTMVPFGQGFVSMSAPSKELEKQVRGVTHTEGAPLLRMLAHGGNSVLRAMASGISISEDPAGNIKPNKASSLVRIDGVVAGIMALGRAMVSQEQSVDVGALWT